VATVMKNQIKDAGSVIQWLFRGSALFTLCEPSLH